MLVVYGIGYRQVRMSIPRQVRIQMVPPCGADIVIEEIDRDCAGLRCRDSRGGSSSSASHPFPAVVARLEIKAVAVLFLCLHGVATSLIPLLPAFLSKLRKFV